MNTVPLAIPGETYFFRDPAAFEALEHELLPPLLDARRAAGRRLHVWSAGCCTGEECYSLAITLSRLLPDIDGWDIRILGTDIDTGFLARAREGVYGEWSFRGVPDTLRQAHFIALDAERHGVRPSLKRLVDWRRHDLVKDPPPGTGFDLALCRHVLMYLEPAQAERAIACLHQGLAPDGWLLVGLIEAITQPFDGWCKRLFGETVFFRKAAAEARVAAERPTTSQRPFQALRKDATDAARQALRRCERAIAADPCDAALHYQHATLLEAAGRVAEARHALRRALFLQPDFVQAQRAMARLKQCPAA